MKTSSNKKTKILLFAFILFMNFSFGFSQIAPVVPTSTSIANASVGVTEQWSGFQNTAALAHIDKIEIATQFENRFMINELSTKSVQAGFNLDVVNLGLSFSQFGYSIYNEILAGIGLARNFDDKFSMGVQFNYYSAYFHAEDESRYRGAVLAQLGIASNITKRLTVGFHTFNPFQTNINTEYTSKRIPSIFSIGTKYQFERNLIWLAQIDKEISSNYRFASGFEYRMVKELTVKMGAYAYEYLVPTIGFGVHLGGFNFHLNGEIHPILGLNTLGHLNYRF